MRKVVSAHEMARLEKLAYEMGCIARDFMLQAGGEVALAAEKFAAKKHLPKEAALLVGKGNNGGDALAAGQELIQKGFRVTAYLLFPKEECTDLNRAMLAKFTGKSVQISPGGLSDLKTSPLFIDGILGTGFQGELALYLQEVVQKVNGFDASLIAVDIPTGVDGASGAVRKAAIKAAMTVYLELPKTGLFLQDGPNQTGELVCGRFGLPVECVAKAGAEFLLFEKEDAASLLPKIKRARHKYEAGSVLAICGSKGMEGAAMLSALAALRAGAGIVKIGASSDMDLQSRAPEIIELFVQEDSSAALAEAARSKAVLVGPGLGRSEKTTRFLSEILPKIKSPMVLDADALFFLSKQKEYNFPNAILTPHKQELQRLLGEGEIVFAKIAAFVKKHCAVLIYKGAPTFIFVKGQLPFVIARGDPGMATAGTGDVLSGILTALLAQGEKLPDAALFGVFLHALSGEIAALEKGSYSLIASDIIECLPEAFRNIAQGTIL